MYTALQQVIITLVKSAITGEKYDLPDDFSFEEILKTARQHQIMNLIYYGAINCGIDKNLPEMQQMFLTACTVISKSERQLYEIDRIMDAFEENGIDFMPLKGTLLKKMFPKSDMRIMGDADILIKTEQYEKIKSIMTDLGFEERIESDHELIWRSKSLLLELHKRLIPSYNKDYYEYFGDGWRLAKHKDGFKYRFEMTPEDNFIYLFTHFAKHYRDAGIGIRHLVDLWVYRMANELNEAYLKKELTKLSLYEFYLNISKTISVWFENGKADEKTDLITEYIFSSGAYGTHYRHIVSAGLKKTKSEKSIKKVKFFDIITLIFPSAENLKQRYPILESKRYLLPAMWVVRWFQTLFCKREVIKKQVYNLSQLTDENISEYQQLLNAVGLDFNFKE